ncbi:DUF1207 domain-containing protein [Spirosoma taeanense]|uniref:DUF1207 domain-containing protein n=1 Tax=Spirosoma taeanense TaxID=2735870 RepID=A0A6M5Y3W7_9BACT|nr:DUF1207 domain-containing protein [Spirosoma taeanense]QJW87891.1 DUF1207 domain-containing protein [Spirosoma taeanense]
MKKTLLTLLLSYQVSILAFGQQPATPPKTTAPAARTLTPAEQKQKERIEREVQRERQIRAEWAQKQREYEAKQAEKERQRQARKAEKERAQTDRDAAKSQPAVTSPEPAPASVDAPVAPSAESTRQNRREKRKKETVAEPAPQPDAPANQPTAAPAAVEAPKSRVRASRPARQKPSVTPSADSAAAPVLVSEPSVIQPRREFLPKGHLFEPILLDPLEAQAYGSFLPVFYTDGEKYPGSIVPFAFGFAKPFYRRTTEPGHSEEWVLDVASFTQFEVYYDYVKDKQRRQIMNTDYKVSIVYNVRRGLNNYRFRVYHLSSHLGDDYLFRNRITAPSPNSVNYEVADATYSRMANNWRLYGGLGIGLRRSEERKRFSAQLGAFYKKPSQRAARLVGGVDMKFWQQTNFRPGIHAGIGVEVGRTTNNLTFLAEGYSGFRPYSQFEKQQTFWLGLGMYLNPF